MEKNTKKVEGQEDDFSKKEERLISDEERKNPYEIGPDVVGGIPPEFI